jgi:4-amino-4-deoxy-L-arabinose transferase-like glycosyltransferase
MRTQMDRIVRADAALTETRQPSVTAVQSKLRHPLVWLATLYLFMGVVGLGVNPAPWYDEGLNTLAARVLLDQGVYGTRISDGLLPFDPAVTSGPTMVLPVAALFGLFGPSMFTGRLVLVAYGLVAIFGFYSIGSSLLGRLGAPFSVLLTIASPPILGVSFLALSRQVLGETAALAFLLAGVLSWYRSWQRSRTGYTVLAGLLFGLSIVTKMQYAISLLPAFLVLAVVKTQWSLRRGQTSPLRDLLPPALATALAIAWLGVSALATPINLRAEYGALNLEGIRILLVPGFWQRVTSQSTQLSMLLMLIAAAGSIWWLSHRIPSSSRDGPRWWLELTLVTIVLLHVLWFGTFSIGWIRYAYLGLILSFFLLSGLIWRVATSVRWFGRALFRERSGWIAVGAFALTLPLHSVAIVEDWGDSTSTELATYIDMNVPVDAVIESWEWEIDALTAHNLYRHPPQSLLLRATEQRFLQGTEFELSYNLDPAHSDYLLLGRFSDWTRVYASSQVLEDFEQIARFGDYRLLARAER